MSDVRIGVTLPQFTGDVERFVAGASRAEGAGLDSVWLFDHLWPLTGGKERPILEQWTGLAWVAARTTSIGIGTLVTRASLRHPALLAKMAATVATIAPGRTTIGLGSGDRLSRPEQEAFGLPYYGGAGRLASDLEILTRYLRDDGYVSWSDDFVAIERLPTSPRASPPPAIWVGGRSEAVLRLAGRFADGWNCWGATPESFVRESQTVLDAASGRDLELSWAGLVQLAGSDADAEAKAAGKPRHIVGGPGKVAAALSAFVEAGAGHLILTLPDAGRPEGYELLGSEVRREMGLG